MVDRVDELAKVSQILRVAQGSVFRVYPKPYYTLNLRDVFDAMAAVYGFVAAHHLLLQQLFGDGTCIACVCCANRSKYKFCAGAS